MDIDLVKLTCKRCGYRWTPAKSPVIRCARCKSKHWETKRTTRQGLRPETATNPALLKFVWVAKASRRQALNLQVLDFVDLVGLRLRI